MVFDFPRSSADPTPIPIASGKVANPQVRFKTETGRLLLLLPPESDPQGVGSVPHSNAHKVSLTWIELWQQFKSLLSGGSRFWQPHTPVYLVAHDRLLDSRQLQAIADALAEVQLRLHQVSTSRRQTAVVAVTAGYSVEQLSPVTAFQPTGSQPATVLAEPLYLQTTLRSGTEVRHSGTIVIVGDINPGSSIIADGDILVWGRLRGVAHAGASGNQRCVILALQMEPTQLRIADIVARGPTNPPTEYSPEVAYIDAEGIRISRALDFHKDTFLSKSS
jgi:septum site-determining protein MinC